MSDLPARILAEIDRVEQRENAYCRMGEPRPAPCPYCGTILGDPCAWRFDRLNGAPAYRMEPCRCPLTFDQWAAIANAEPSPDEAVLRGCAAGRRIVKRHEPRDAGVRTKWVICDYCSHVPDAVEWPCPDIVDLAAGYDITVDGEA